MNTRATSSRAGQQPEGGHVLPPVHRSPAALPTEIARDPSKRGSREIAAYTDAQERFEPIMSQDEIDEQERLGAPGSGLAWGLLFSFMLIAATAIVGWVAFNAVMIVVQMWGEA